MQNTAYKLHKNAIACIERLLFGLRTGKNSVKFFTQRRHSSVGRATDL